VQQVAKKLSKGKSLETGLQKYEKFLLKSAELTEQERMNAFGLDVHSEDAFLPALQINYSLLYAFDIEKYWIPKTEYEKGLLVGLGVDEKQDLLLEDEILHASRLFAEKYQADPVHFEQVRKLAIQLFEQTKEIHGLGAWEMMLLKVAAIIHEVGGYVSPRMHHKHSYYLIKNSEIFGLDDRNLDIVAHVARYHRQSTPRSSHKDYSSLSSEDQILISKLSALLRVADALDVAQQQRIQSLSCKKKKDQLKLIVEGPVDLALEKISLKNKGNLFEELFGLYLQLESVK